MDEELDKIKQKKIDEMAKKAEGPVVEIYSTPTCPYCTMAKQYFDSIGVAYKDYNVAVDRAAAQKMITSTGQQGVPQINIDGKWIIGFNKPAIDQALGR